MSNASLLAGLVRSVANIFKRLSSNSYDGKFSVVGLMDDDCLILAGRTGSEDGRRRMPPSSSDMTDGLRSGVNMHVISGSLDDGRPAY